MPDLERRQKILERIKQEHCVYVSELSKLVDSTKFDKISFAKTCDFDKISIFVTDKEPRLEWREFIESRQIKLIC